MTDTAVLALHVYRDGAPASLPIVLLHGFPLDHRMWDDVAPMLAGPGAVLAPDLPGLGASPSAEACGAALGRDDEPSLDTSADAVAATLHARGIDRAIVVGLSMGGYVALAMLERHQGLVAGVGLLDTRSEADDESVVSHRLQIVSTVMLEHSLDAVAGMRTTLLGATSQVTRPELAGRLGEWIADQVPTGVAWSELAMATRPDRTEMLRAFTGPALVMVGEEDTAAPFQVARQMAEALRDVELVVVPQAGHLTTIENPASVAAGLNRLMARCAALVR
jgi:pimeloyl-ACP methyl ester carboxylesterase